jgi:hypothetical protein
MGANPRKTIARAMAREERSPGGFIQESLTTLETQQRSDSLEAFRRKWFALTARARERVSRFVRRDENCVTWRRACATREQEGVTRRASMLERRRPAFGSKSSLIREPFNAI